MEVWHQVYAPLGGTVTSALVASIPLIALFYMLAFRKSKGHHLDRYHSRVGLQHDC